MKVFCVIGAGYGDEGKGMWVNHRAKGNRPLVIRANGGAQVGHSVIRNGKRYIFSHLGAGTLRLAPTFFTRYSVVNPLLFNKETEGRNSGIPYKVFVDFDTPVTTPYDMILNQVTESCRGVKRHGSVGVGFGVTLQREEDGAQLHYSDLTSLTFNDKLKRVREWFFYKLGQSQILDSDNNFVREIHKLFDYVDYKDPSSMIPHNLFGNFVDDCKRFTSNTEAWIPTKNRLTDYDTLIFENGQGLMLDQEYGAFPHVTRSNTGFRNIGKILKHNNLFNEVPLVVDYISRCYTTRHGNGPLPFHREKLIGIDAVDFTNIYNCWQETMRFAPLNMHDINAAIEWDKKSHPSDAVINRVVTCCDQIQGNVWNDPNSSTGHKHFVEIVGKYNSPVFLTATNFFDFISSNFNVKVGDPEGPR